jgi:DNA-binding transcriptional MerR regulator
MATVLPLGKVAEHFEVPIWQVRRLFQRGLLPEAPRVGPYRVVGVDDLPQVEKALRDAGYLPAEGAAHA